jgi:hypothetical protein
LRVDYIVKHRHADALVERKYPEFVSVNLDPGLLPRKLYDNLRKLGVIYRAEKFGDVDVQRLSYFFYETIIDFNVPVFSNVNVFQSGFFLYRSTQFVRSGEKEFSVGSVTCGVPQGLLLFVSYINEGY